MNLGWQSCYNLMNPSYICEMLFFVKLQNYNTSGFVYDEIDCTLLKAFIVVLHASEHAWLIGTWLRASPPHMVCSPQVVCSSNLWRYAPPLPPSGSLLPLLSQLVCSPILPLPLRWSALPILPLPLRWYALPILPLPLRWSALPSLPLPLRWYALPSLPLPLRWSALPPFPFPADGLFPYPLSHKRWSASSISHSGALPLPPPASDGLLPSHLRLSSPLPWGGLLEACYKVDISNMLTTVEYNIFGKVDLLPEKEYFLILFFTWASKY